MARVVRRMIFDRRSYLYSSGYFASLRDGVPTNRDDVIPWMNFSMVEFLQERLPSDVRLFEYGSGASTRFWAKRVRQVISCEHDETWYARIGADLPDNAHVFYQKLDEENYARAISAQDGEFDVVVVDGRLRPMCVRHSVTKLTDRGVIVLDDTHRPTLKEAVEFMRDQGYRQLTISGLKPLKSARHATTIFYRDGNCLGL
jgi:precorrin-6B methylase 2